MHAGSDWMNVNGLCHASWQKSGLYNLYAFFSNILREKQPEPADRKDKQERAYKEIERINFGQRLTRKKKEKVNFSNS